MGLDGRLVGGGGGGGGARERGKSKDVVLDAPTDRLALRSTPVLSL